MPLQSAPGQIQQLTPPCDEQVPLRFCEQLYVPSLHLAVAAPQGALVGVQLDPGGGAETTDSVTSNRVSAVSVTLRVVVV